MTTLAPLLHHDARDASRALALHWIERIVSAAAQLRERPTDIETVHATRVAITRLRATLRIYRGMLDGGIGERGKAELRTLNRALGRVRDLDVQLEWLAAHHESFSEDMHAGSDWLVADLLCKREARVRRIGSTLTRHLDVHVESWQHQLSNYQVARVVGQPLEHVTLAAVIVQQMHRAVRRIERAVKEAAENHEPEKIHEARIAVKQLRALLVPWLDDVPEIKPLYETLSRAQDTVGAMRDAHLLAERTLRAARHNPELATSLKLLASHLEMLSAEHGDEFSSEWLADGGRAALRHVPDASQALSHVARADHEIERKFLLHSAPPLALAEPSVRIAQGWLPGVRLRERLRRSVHANGDVEWTRTVKVGTGVSRVEVEEQTDPVLFESLWPLTVRARVEKVRHTIVEGAFKWEIDVFLDRELFLAEVELPSAETLVTLPEWLAPSVVREVTGESEYVNANLAIDKSRPAGPAA